MTCSKELLYKLHRLSFANRPLVEKATVCGCFHCGTIYSPDVIDPETDYCIDSPCDTATCPYCWIDSVICDSMGTEVTPELLEEMRVEFFEKNAEDDSNVLEATEEPDDNLKSISFPCGGNVVCQVAFTDGRTKSLRRNTLAEALELEHLDGADIKSAFPSGTGVVLYITLQNDMQRAVKWSYKTGLIQFIE